MASIVGTLATTKFGTTGVPSKSELLEKMEKFQKSDRENIKSWKKELELIKIAPSIMCANFLNLGEVIEELEAGGADLIHFDIMDGNFVPGFALGERILRDVRGKTNLPIEVHLMTLDPERHVEKFAKEGANIISVPVETCRHLHQVVKLIKRCGVKPGVALNPATPLNEIEYILQEISVVTIMSIDPGYVGQRFLPFVLPKIRKLAKIIKEQKVLVDIQIDGGIDEENDRLAVEAGANILVHGIFTIFKGDRSVREATQQVKNKAQEWHQKM